MSEYALTDLFSHHQGLKLPRLFYEDILSKT